MNTGDHVTHRFRKKENQMMQKRIFMAAIAVIFLSGTIFAGGEREVAVPEDIEWVTPDRIGNPNARITLTFSIGAAYSHRVDAPERREYLWRRSEEWARANPDVKLIPQGLPGGEERLARTLEQAASGTISDFAMVDGVFARQLHRWAQPIDDYVTEEEQNDWFEWAREDAMIDPADGRLKALWMTSNTVGLWYRKDLMDPPQDWDSFIEAGHYLMEKHGYPHGFLAMARLEQIMLGMVVPQFYGLGGNLVDENERPVFGEGENRAKMIEVFSFWERAIDEGVFPETAVDMASPGDLVTEARAGQLAMFLGGSWLLDTMRRQFGDDLEKWDFTYIPQKSASITGTDGTQTPGGYNVVFFTKDKEKLAYAVDYMMHVYTGREGMAEWSLIGGYTPPRKSVLQDKRILEDRWQQAFGEVVAVAKGRSTESYPAISQSLMNAMQSLIIGRATPEEAVDTAFAETLQNLRR
jgi:multiple sugar transport system substrate-binding protein